MDKLIKKITKYNNEKLEKYFINTELTTLHELKNFCDDDYFNSKGELCLKDHQYDLLKDIIIQKEDKNYVLPVGAKIREDDNKADLPFYLGSMNKFKTDHEIEKWISKFPSKNYLIQEKLDGVSCLLIYKNNEIKLFTRGDGYIGSDISYFAPYLKSIPKNLSKVNINIRGELILPKKVFEEKHKDNFANPRNMVAGIINSKTLKNGIEDILFVAYEIINDDINKNQMKPIEQLEKLQELGFETVIYETIEYKTVNKSNINISLINMNTKTLSDILIRMKKNSLFDIDGIIIISANKQYKRNIANNPEYQFAFKLNIEKAIVQVINVEWNITKWSVLKPRIQVTPVNLNGVTINFCTGFNAKFIVDNSINVGSEIEITRANDVIPHIVGIIKKSDKPSLPANIDYKWSESKIDIIATDDILDEISNIKIISHFFSSLNIKYINEATVKKFFDIGLNTIIKILKASKDDFLNVKNFSDKSADRVWTNIREGLLDLTVPKVLGASSVFGFGMGMRKIQALFDEYPNILDDFDILSNQEIIDNILLINGFQRITAEKITYHLPYAKQFLQDISPLIVFKQNIKEDEFIVKNLQDTKIVFSGLRNKELENTIIKAGGQVTSSVSKNTDYLITNDVNSSNSKILKAKELNIPIFLKEEFISKYF
jgi:NAD-dependent DNA ligase